VPVLGVTCYTPGASEQCTYALPCEYVRCLKAAGADVVVLAEGDAGRLLSRVDGLVLAGGGDIDPELYGARLHTTHYGIDPARDRFEADLLRRARTIAMPVLAICRGMQVLNVVCGGNLVSHVPERWGDEVAHRAPPRVPVTHEVELDHDSKLAAVMGAGRFAVVSWHHQAIDRLGSGLRVVARSTDGVPEAVEADGPEWLFGVQWHPELDAHTSPRQAALLRGAVAAAEAYARSRR